MPPAQPAPTWPVRPPRQTLHAHAGAATRKSRIAVGPLVVPMRHAPDSTRIDFTPAAISTLPTVLSISQPLAPRNVSTCSTPVHPANQIHRIARAAATPANAATGARRTLVAAG